MMKTATALLALVALCGVLPGAAQEPEQEVTAKAQKMAQEAEGKVEKAEAEMEQAEGMAEQAEAKMQQAEGMAEQAEAKMQEAEGMAEKAEAKMQEAESMAEQAEGMAEKVRDAGATLEEVLESHYEALGGEDAWLAVDTVRYEGTMSMAPGMDAPFKMTMQRPDRIRLEFTFQNMTGIQAASGDAAWMVMPFMGKNDPEEMPAEMADQLKEQADIEGALFDWADKGHQVELLGVVEVEGTDAYKVKLTHKSGDVHYHFLDTDRYMTIKQETRTKVQGQEMDIETEIGDYKKICAATSTVVDAENPCGGDVLVFPHSIVSKAKGAPTGQAITITSVALNPEDVAADYFTMPAKQVDEAGTPAAAEPGA